MRSATILLVAALWCRPGLAGAQSVLAVHPGGWVKAASTPAASAPAEATTAAAAPSYHDYFEALGYSFTHGLFSREQIAPAAIGAAAALAFLPVDQHVSDHVRSDVGALNRGGQVIGSPITLGVVSGGLILGGLATDDQKFRTFAFSYSQGLILAETLAGAVKLALPRDRPDGTSRYSFPSGHAAGSFALAAVSAHYYGAKVGVPLYTVASLVALSRVTYGKHFPSDVIAGAAIGYVSAMAAVRGTEHVTGKSAGAPALALGARSVTFSIQF